MGSTITVSIELLQEIESALLSALPFVENSLQSPDHKQADVARKCNQIRVTITEVREASK